VCVTLSIWSDPAAIADFNQLLTHVQAARWGMLHSRRNAAKKMQVWSTHWQLHATSMNLSWDDFDLSSRLSWAHVSDHREEEQEVK
jgi:hypothetical protein